MNKTVIIIIKHFVNEKWNLNVVAAVITLIPWLQRKLIVNISKQSSMSLESRIKVVIVYRKSEIAALCNGDNLKYFHWNFSQKIYSRLKILLSGKIKLMKADRVGV